MDNKAIGSFIRQRRIELGLTQEELADLVGESKGTIQHWENARRCVHLDQVSRLCSALQITPDQLINLEQPSRDPLPEGMVALLRMVAQAAKIASSEIYTKKDDNSNEERNNNQSS